MIAVVDYGVGNLFSLRSSLACVGAESVVTGEEKVLRSAEKIILPGVGAFGDAVKKLQESGLFSVVKEEAEKGKPLMGICLGMQLLFEKSYEFGEHDGLGLLEGKIKYLGDYTKSEKIPHIGWNALDIKKDSPIFKYIKNGDYVYFVHSYFATDCEKSVTATSSYGVPVTACVQKNNVFGCQFHPEKSGDVGLNILKAFAEHERF